MRNDGQGLTRATRLIRLGASMAPEMHICVRETPGTGASASSRSVGSAVLGAAGLVLVTRERDDRGR